ncbi:MAG: M48 family metallopeptidase [Leptolyngbya sp.]|nr:M48 family metallopeptidase [Candidatus Melainabacteria bacterium]
MAQVVAVGVLGYVYIWFILLALVALTFGTLILLLKIPILAIKVGLPLLALIGVILKSFWLKSEPVAGMYLTKKDYPEMFAFVEKVRKSIKAPDPHHIIINTEFNAAVIQRPRLGLLGWHKNYLILGLPLLQAFSIEQFEAVLAHEMGHLAEKHSAKIAWIYHVRSVYAQLMQNLAENNSFGQGLFRSFLQWYFPYFDAYSFALRRTQEHYADQFAVDLVGKENAAAMLIGTDIKASFFYKNYWNNIQKEGANTKVPPSNAFSLWQGAVKKDIKEEDAQIWLLESLNRKTNYDDSHPSPTERLSRMLDIPAGEVADYARANLEKLLYVEKTAAQSLFAERTVDVFTHHDLQWQREIAPVWEQNFEIHQAFKEELYELEAKERAGEIKDEELLALAAQTARVKDFKTAKPIFLVALEKNPDDAELHHAYGEWLMDDKDPECQKHLELAMKLERSRTYECCQLLYGWMASHHREDEADGYAETIIEWTADFEGFQKERSDLYSKDEFQAHGISGDKLALFVEVLKDFPEIKKAHMVEKVVKYFPERKLYVIVFEIKKPFFSADAMVANFFAKLNQSVSFPGNCLLIDMPKMTPRLKQSLNTIEDSLLFER